MLIRRVVGGCYRAPHSQRKLHCSVPGSLRGAMAEAEEKDGVMRLFHDACDAGRRHSPGGTGPLGGGDSRT